MLMSPSTPFAPEGQAEASFTRHAIAACTRNQDREWLAGVRHGQARPIQATHLAKSGWIRRPPLPALKCKGISNNQVTHGPTIVARLLPCKSIVATPSVQADW